MDIWQGILSLWPLDADDTSSNAAAPPGGAFGALGRVLSPAFDDLSSSSAASTASTVSRTASWDSRGTARPKKGQARGKNKKDTTANADADHDALCEKINTLSEQQMKLSKEIRVEKEKNNKTDPEKQAALDKISRERESLLNRHPAHPSYKPRRNVDDDRYHVMSLAKHKNSPCGTHHPSSPWHTHG